MVYKVTYKVNPSKKVVKLNISNKHQKYTLLICNTKYNMLKSVINNDNQKYDDFVLCEDYIMILNDYEHCITDPDEINDIIKKLKLVLKELEYHFCLNSVFDDAYNL